jgi:tetratricopeptide (TPR) repeat protein
VLTTWPVTTQAAVSVIGSSLAVKCYERAEMGSTYIRECDEALEDSELISRDRASTLVNRGIVYNNAGKYEEALADFEMALAIDSEIPEAYLNRGNSRFFQQRINDAVADYTRAIDLDIDRMGAALYNRSIAYGRLGDLRAARADLQAAVAAEPDFEEAQAQLAILDRLLAQTSRTPSP